MFEDYKKNSNTVSMTIDNNEMGYFNEENHELYELIEQDRLLRDGNKLFYDKDDIEAKEILSTFFSDSNEVLSEGLFTEVGEDMVEIFCPYTAVFLSIPFCLFDGMFLISSIASASNKSLTEISRM